MLSDLKRGTNVRRTMGIREFGIVIGRIPRDQYTDGQYREPLPHERPVYVQWSNGSRGWLHRSVLAPL